MKTNTQEAVKEQETIVKFVEPIPSRKPLFEGSEGALCHLLERVEAVSLMLNCLQEQMIQLHQSQEKQIEKLMEEVRSARTTQPDNLMTYYEVGLYLKLSGKDKKSIVRAAQRIVRRFRVPKVRLGHRTVKFRPADIEKLKSRLAGDQMWRE